MPKKKDVPLKSLPEWWVWQGIKQRCFNSSAPNYADYGGRGVTLSTEWYSFHKFYLDMGPRPSSKHSIDRIDNDRHYSKENCRWATSFEQNNNRRRWTHSDEWRRKMTGRQLTKQQCERISDRAAKRNRSSSGKFLPD